MRLVISPFMVQGRTGEGVHLEPVETGMPVNPYHIPDQRLATETEQVAQIRFARDNTKRTLMLGGEGFDSTRLDIARYGSWALAHAICGQQGIEPALYLLRDQTQYDVSSAGKAHEAHVDGLKVYVRSEEGLLPLAHDIIESAKIAATSRRHPSVQLCEETTDCVVRINGGGGASHIPLRGYEFNPRDTADASRTRFSHYPSCEVFLAASALEQTVLGDDVVRICHFGLKNRDYAARSLLGLIGYDELSVETVAVGDDGGINKIFSWHSSRSRQSSIREVIRSGGRQQMLTSSTSPDTRILG